MFGGLTLTDLCIGVIAMSSAIIVVCAVAVFTACHALLFIAIPLGQLIIGIGLLTNPYDLKVVQSSVPYLSQVLLLDRELIAVIGFLLASSALSIHYVGQSVKSTPKVVHCALVFVLSIILSVPRTNGQCLASIGSLLGCQEHLVIYGLALASLISAIGHYSGPYIMKAFDNNRSVSSAC